MLDGRHPVGLGLAAAQFAIWSKYADLQKILIEVSVTVGSP